MGANLALSDKSTVSVNTETKFLYILIQTGKPKMEKL